MSHAVLLHKTLLPAWLQPGKVFTNDIRPIDPGRSATAAFTGILVVCMLLASGSCSKPTTKPAAASWALPATRDTLRMTRRVTRTGAFLEPAGIAVAGPAIVVSDARISPHFVVIDRVTGAVLRRFGTNGQGAGEFLGPLDLFAVPGSRRLLTVYDYRTARVSYIDPLASGANGQVVKQLVLPASGEIQGPMGPHVIPQGLSSAVPVGTHFVSNGTFLNGSLAIEGAVGHFERFTNVGAPFGDLMRTDTMAALRLKRTHMGVSYHGDRVVLVYQYANRLDFSRGNGSRYLTTSGPYEVRYNYLGAYRGKTSHYRLNPDGELGYTAVAATERYVYALFCGCRIGDDRYAQNLQVFDWKGTLVATATLDKELLNFAVSPDGAELYGAYDAPKPAIGVWDIGRWLTGIDKMRMGEGR